MRRRLCNCEMEREIEKDVPSRLTIGSWQSAARKYRVQSAECRTQSTQVGTLSTIAHTWEDATSVTGTLIDTSRGGS